MFIGGLRLLTITSEYKRDGDWLNHSRDHKTENTWDVRPVVMKDVLDHFLLKMIKTDSTEPKWRYCVGTVWNLMTGFQTVSVVPSVNGPWSKAS